MGMGMIRATAIFTGRQAPELRKSRHGEVMSCLVFAFNIYGRDMTFATAILSVTSQLQHFSASTTP